MKKLHNYQIKSADHIIKNKFSYLMLEVGLGKTASTLTALNTLFNSGDVISALVIAPKRVAESVWLEECQMWSPDITMTVIKGTPAERLKLIKSKSQIKVIGRDNIKWLIDNFEKKWPFDCLIIDESQSFKDPSSQRFKAIKKVRKHIDRVILLSATPCSEGLMGLWSQVYIGDGGQRLGKSFTAYKQAFFESDFMGWKWEPRKGSETALFSRIEDVSISMTADDYLTLPERVNNVIAVKMSDAEMAIYQKMEKDYILPVLDSEIIAANAAVLWGKLHQLSGGAMYDADRNPVYFSDVKIEALNELIESANGQPVLVFYGYRHELDRIKKAIKGSQELDVVKWNKGLQPVALAHAESCGAGLNLQHGGNIAVWFSIPASLGQYIQACGRLHRQGQTKSVIIHHLIAEGTIDEDVMAALKDKGDVQKMVIQRFKKSLAHL